MKTAKSEKNTAPIAGADTSAAVGDKPSTALADASDDGKGSAAATDTAPGSGDAAGSEGAGDAGTAVLNADVAVDNAMSDAAEVTLEMTAVDQPEFAPSQTLSAHIAQASKRALAAGDHAGHALLNDLEIRFGEIKMRLPSSIEGLSADIGDIVSELKRSL